MATTRLVQNLKADNDPSGNPQRLWVMYLLDDGDDYAGTYYVADEGYRGKPESFKGLTELPAVRIPKSEYHALVRHAKRTGIYLVS